MHECTILDTLMPKAPAMMLAMLPQNGECIDMSCSHMHGLARTPRTQSERDLTTVAVQPCYRYNNSKDPQQQLFLAEAALHLLTEELNYRDDADSFVQVPPLAEGPDCIPLSHELEQCIPTKSRHPGWHGHCSWSTESTQTSRRVSEAALLHARLCSSGVTTPTRGRPANCASIHPSQPLCLCVCQQE